MPISGVRRKRRNREATAGLTQVTVNELRADMATSKEEMNQRIQELRVDFATLKEEMNQRVFAGPAMTDLEELRHLIEQNHKQIQRQLQQMQAQTDRHSGRYGTEFQMDRTLLHCYGWRLYFGTFLWILVILGLIFGCAWNLRELLLDMIESPTVTKMTFTLHDNLSLPPITVYQLNGYPMLHEEKLLKALENGSLTEAYLEGIIKGVGIGFLREENSTVTPSGITEAYTQAILQYGSLTEAGLAFQKGYGIACDELFTYCGEVWSPPMNCCDIFELLWGLNGAQYALKRNTIFLDAFRGFFVKLRSLPNLNVLQKGDFVKKSGNYQSYWLGIGNGVDQTGFDTHSFEMKPSQTVIVMLRQKRRNLKISKDCVDLPARLRYFRDYTISNCYVERCFLNKLPLCNVSCEIPLLQLLNSDNLSGPPCEFDVFNSMCLDIIQANQPQCSTNHGCRIPCNYTEVEYPMVKVRESTDPREISLYFEYETTEVQTFEETSRLTLWEYLGLIGSILDLWLGITIFSLYRILFLHLSKIIHFKSIGN